MYDIYMNMHLCIIVYLYTCIHNICFHVCVYCIVYCELHRMYMYVQSYAPIVSLQERGLTLPLL